MLCAVLDLEIGNIKSIINALKFVGSDVKIIKNSKDFKDIDRLIIPGVGSFNSFMKKIKNDSIDTEIKNFAKKGNPILGICLGMQVLLSKGYEFGEIDGLNFLKGSVKKIPNKQKINKFKLPLVGWYTLKTYNNFHNKLIKNCNPFQFYYMHSYYCEMLEKKDIKNFITYNGMTIPALISYQNIFGVQFHPEKSGKAGLNLLRNFLNN